MDKNETYLEEAFKALDSLSLTEDVFELTTDGLEDANDFMNMDFDEVEDVIDVEASDKEELKDSYIGNVILDCNVCHSKLYKKPEDVIIDEETEVANIEEACPYCQSNDGYAVIGQVTEYCSHCEDEDKEEEHKEEKEEDSDRDYELKKDDLKESKRLNESIYSEVQDFLKNATKYFKDTQDGCYYMPVTSDLHLVAGYPSDEDIPYVKIAFNADDLQSDYEWDWIMPTYSDGEVAIVEISLRDNDLERDAKYLVREAQSMQKEIDKGNLLLESCKSRKSKKSLKESSTRDDIDADADDKKERARRKFAKAKDDADADRDYKLKKKGLRESIEDIVRDIQHNEQTRVSRWTDDGEITIDSDQLYSTDIDLLCRRLRQKGYDCTPISTRTLKLNIKKDLDESDKPAAVSIEDAQKWVDYDMKKYGRISARTNRLVKKAGFQIIKDDHGDYEVAAGKFESCNEDFSKVDEEKIVAKVLKELGADKDNWEIKAKDIPNAIYKVLGKDVDDDLYDNIYSKVTTKISIYSESLKEDFEKVEIETDKEKMSMTAEENGKVTVTTEPKEEIKEEEKAEVIEPVSDEVKAEFKTTEEESEEDKYADIDIDEFDEEEFDSLGEQYLKRVYENVKSFKTTKGSVNGNTLKLEGLITFKSGKQVKTNFVFEARTITKTGKLKFIGENKQFAKGKKSFILTGKMNANKLVVESFTYNYKSKDPKSGQIKKLYGRVAK